ncbi:hypothetical protein CPAR01_08831 [Colletotrichum paranaense]|uniref:Uncharacterized protein n=1 Tax=Colletotrichum paranaense TaxID=1914294 RepID=A0ABQ9SG47_9PEZI|nr:uncharacterized protein CPAR01_08831 [Colletotrichum paranaense]KAK1535289.1 hypothetical protein CPAR01_08831 [Colletotrichum paranaense]
MLLPSQDPLGVHPHHPPPSLAPPYHITDVTTIICDPILIALVILHLSSTQVRSNCSFPTIYRSTCFEGSRPAAASSHRTIHFLPHRARSASMRLPPKTSAKHPHSIGATTVAAVRRRDVKRHVAKYSPQLGPVLDSILELRIPALYLVVYARSPVELTPIISALADLLSTDRLNLGCLLQPTHTISFERLRRFHMHLAEAI